jgi:uncharacterized protein YbjT (DUF2867 family)
VNVLLLGAYGFIGSQIARALLERDDAVTGFGRDVDYGQRILPRATWLRGDLAAMQSAKDWTPALAGINAVVNASGLLQNGDGGSVQAVQLRAVAALVEACERSGVERFIQISAAGAHGGAATDFMRTKAAADVLLERSTVPALILRPGLVIGRNSFGGTDLIRAAAAAPVELRLPISPPIQCTDLEDLLEATIAALHADEPRRGSFDLVERRGRSLNEIVSAHRQWLGIPKPKLALAMPGWILSLVSRIADLFGHLGWRSPLRRNALLSLQAGVRGDSGDAVAILRREPSSLEAALARMPAGKQDRLHARVGLVQPLLIASLFIMWAGSGAATLRHLDAAANILSESWIGQRAAYAVAVGGGWIDIVLAAGLLWRRTIRPALLTMIVLTILVYLAGGTLLVPELWADPLAPLAKAIPATMLALITYWVVEKR